MAQVWTQQGGQGHNDLCTSYEAWLRERRIQVIRGYAAHDIAGAPLGPWGEGNLRGVAVQLVGMGGLTGAYIVEIPPRGQVDVERHLYEELIYIVSGSGEAEVWSGGRTADGSRHHRFAWSTGSLFALPLNSWHRLLNISETEPARVFAVTLAPLVMDLYHNARFVFDSDFSFADRFDGNENYFRSTGIRTTIGRERWLEVNRPINVRAMTLDNQDAKGPGTRVTGYQMSGNVLVGHVSEWPVGRYQKAHHHAGGQVLLIVRSSGYTLMWPPDATTQPFKNGHGDRVVRINWAEGSVLCPPWGWFHQHFNTGSVPARQVALRLGSKRHRVAIKDAFDNEGVLVSVKRGGNQIEFQDEDPEIGRLYHSERPSAGPAVAE